MERDLDPKYTAMCSEQTIYSNKEGFFGEFFESLKKASPKKWINKVFGTAKSDRERLVTMLEEPNVSATLFGMLEHVTAVYKLKDAKGSELRRREGERLLGCSDVKKAVILLSQAVLRAPIKGLSNDVFVDIFRSNSLISRRKSNSRWWTITCICIMV